MYSNLNDYLTSENPRVREQGILTFAEDYGIEDTVQELWSTAINSVLYGLDTEIEYQGKTYSVWELDLPNHRILLMRIRKKQNVSFVREELNDKQKELKTELQCTVSKESDAEVRQAIYGWATSSLRTFISKLLAWHQIQ